MRSCKRQRTTYQAATSRGAKLGENTTLPGGYVLHLAEAGDWKEKFEK